MQIEGTLVIPKLSTLEFLTYLAKCTEIQKTNNTLGISNQVERQDYEIFQSQIHRHNCVVLDYNNNLVHFADTEYY